MVVGKQAGLTLNQVQLVLYQMAGLPVRPRGASARGWGVPFSDEEIARYVDDLKALGADEDRYVARTLCEQVAAKHRVKTTRVQGAWQRHLRSLGKLSKRDPVRTLVDYVFKRLDRFTAKEVDRFFYELKKALDGP